MSERGNSYPPELDVPPLVRRCADTAKSLGFANSCAPSYGRLLHLLAASARGVIGEMGTGCGVGTAWMASAAAADTPIVTIELNGAQAAAAREAFVDVPNVTVLQGDAFDIAPYGPFDLLFCDSIGKRERQDQTIALLARGGVVVLDDLTPGREGPDDVRDFWLACPDVIALEITLTPDEAAILAVRR